MHVDAKALSALGFLSMAEGVLSASGSASIASCSLHEIGFQGDEGRFGPPLCTVSFSHFIDRLYASVGSDSLKKHALAKAATV